MRRPVAPPSVVKYLAASLAVFVLVSGAGFEFTRRYVQKQKHALIDAEVEDACRILLKLQSVKRLGAEAALDEFMKINPNFFALETAVVSLTGPQSASLQLPFDRLSRAAVCEVVHEAGGGFEGYLRLGDSNVLVTSFRPPSKSSLSPRDDGTADQFRIFRRHPLIFGLLPEELNGILLLACLSFGFLLSTLTTYFLVTRAAASASYVLNEIRNGNLKARMPNDPRRGPNLASLFNEMADQIESLVGRTQTAERVRTELLRELAHDLKTPVASLRALLESVRDRRESMSKDQQADFLDTGIGETLYFGRLVEDLLFISGVDSPDFSAKAERVDFSRVVQDEVARVKTGCELEIRVEIPPNLAVRGEDLLLRRLVRNGLDNGLAFAESALSVSLTSGGDALTLTIADDGPGLTAEDASAFGTKRKSRRAQDSLLSNTKAERISLGLGSVIMRKIANLHGGDATIANGGPDFGEKGATLTIRLKT